MNYFKTFSRTAMIAVLALTISCSDDDNNTAVDVAKESFTETYAEIVAANYNDSYTTAVTMQTAINAFLAAPSEATLEAAQDAWLYARDFYGQTEAFREANGPIDNEDLLATEGQINAWPLDEGYIDYVFDSATHQYVNNGIIADDSFVITAENLIGANEKDDVAEDIATGWHAIEFLLWGQDLNHNPTTHESSYAISGLRPYTDYTNADYATRRGTYLKVVTDLLVSDLKDLNDTWAEGGSYRITFESLDNETALTNILNGIGFISNGEIAAERIDPAIDEGQENEHSCFSDNTNQDMWANVNGINNIIVGKYTAENGTIVSGTSLIELATASDATTATELGTTAANTIAKLNALLALGKTFDEIISEETLGSNGPAGQLSTALKAQGTAIADVATAIGVSISIN